MPDSGQPKSEWGKGHDIGFKAGLAEARDLRCAISQALSLLNENYPSDPTRAQLYAAQTWLKDGLAGIHMPPNKWNKEPDFVCDKAGHATRKCRDCSASHPHSRCKVYGRDNDQCCDLHRCEYGRRVMVKCVLAIPKRMFREKGSMPDNSRTDVQTDARGNVWGLKQEGSVWVIQYRDRVNGKWGYYTRSNSDDADVHEYASRMLARRALRRIIRNIRPRPNTEE